ncbi:MAG: PD-(D/E)XK nuclease family protein [Christensenellales bacterium]
MNINIVASSSSEINNKYIFNLLKDRDKTKKHIIIAPDRSQFSLEQRLFEETGEKCFFDVNVISLSRLAKSQLLNNTKKILTKQSGVALVKKILENNKDKLFAFGKATSFLGFASSLFETICFYKSCNISPSEIYTDDSKTFSNLKQKDIKFVYEEYEKYLQNEYTDSFNQLRLFADSINKDTFCNTIFYLLEFDDFTRLMYEIISKISRFSDGIYITCTYGKGNDNSNIFSNKVYYDLIDLFKSEGLEFKINKLNGFDNSTLDFLSKNLLAYSPKQFDLSDISIRVNAFDEIKHEIKYTIADIYSKAILNQENFSNFTIVLPSLKEYKSIIVEELNKYQIPFYIDESMLLIDNYLIRLLFEICNVIGNKDYKLSDFSSIIKSPLLNFESEDTCKLDNTLSKIGAVSDMCLNETLTSNQDLLEFILLIKETREEINKEYNFSDFVNVIIKIFDYIKSRNLDFLTDNSLENRIYNQVINKFDDINKDITSVFGHIKTSFTEFLEIYKSYFEATNISLPPITSNTVFIADFNTSYVSNVDHLYILGNNEGRLPKMKLDNGLVTDEELSKLPNAKLLTPTISMLNSRKVFKLFELVFKYKKTLTLSYLNSSLEGKLYPNNLINSLIKISGLKVYNQSNVLDTINRNYNSLDVNNVIFNNLTPNILNENLINYLSEWEVYNNNLNYRNIVSSLYKFVSEDNKKIINNFNASNKLNNLSISSYFRTGYSSISQIETFNMCPYMHFGRYGLRLKEGEESKLKPNDIGNIIHEVLSKIVPLIVDNTLNMENIMSKAKMLMEKVLLKEEYKDIVNNKSNAFVIKALDRELDRIINAISNEIKNSNFKPKYYEYRFDNLEIDGVKIKGFIDRIDVCGNDFIVLDYKTGDNQFKNYNDVMSGKKLQLLLYAKAFAEKSGLNPVGAFYLPLSNAFGEDASYKLNGVMIKSDDNIINMDSGLIAENYKSEIINLKTTSTGKIYENNYYKNLCLSKEDFDYLLSFAINQVKKAIFNIKSGEISPRPLADKNKSTCDYCSFKALCNYNFDNDNNVVNVENITQLKEIGETDGGI